MQQATPWPDYFNQHEHLAGKSSQAHMSTRLLLFNLRTDADDHILGFTTTWLNALAKHYDAVDVLTTHAGRIAVAPNVSVYSVGREKGYSQPRRIFEFYRILFSLLLRHRYSACFAHMQPLFATMAGVPLTLFRVPLTTWYTHRQLTRQLRLATFFSRRVVSAVTDSFPLKTPKLRVTGHGIDTEFYKPDLHPQPPPHCVERGSQTNLPSNYSSERNAPLPAKRGGAGGGDKPCIVYVARLTPIKHQTTLLRAVVPLEAEVVLVGDIPDGYEDAYKRELLALVEELNLADRVIFAGAQTPEQVRDGYHRADAAVNLSPPGLFDKAALESMACGVPTIVSNPAFEPLTALYQSQLQIDSPENVTQLTEKLRDVLALSPEERQRIGQHLREQVIQHHSLKALIEKLVKIVNTGES